MCFRYIEQNILIKIILPHFFLRLAIRIVKIIYVAQIIFLLDSTALDLTPSLQKIQVTENQVNDPRGEAIK